MHAGAAGVHTARACQMLHMDGYGSAQLQDLTGW